MDFTTEDLEEFQKAYEKDFGETCSIDEARSMASRVMRFVLGLHHYATEHPEEFSDVEHLSDVHTPDCVAPSSPEQQPPSSTPPHAAHEAAP